MLVMYGPVLPVLCLGLWGGMAIKKRVTWPRTGYMAPRKVTRSSIPALVFAFGTAVLVAAAVAIRVDVHGRVTPQFFVMLRGPFGGAQQPFQIGRASCRETVQLIGFA